MTTNATLMNVTLMSRSERLMFMTAILCSSAPYATVSETAMQKALEIEKVIDAHIREENIEPARVR